jgi:hypothetical protein
MNLIVWRDRALVAGLAVALIVVFVRPIRHLLDLARDVERNSGLALVPALIILTGVFLFHQQGRRQEAGAQAAAAAALEAEGRASEMERLVNFSPALGRSLDLDAIRDVIAQHLPRLSRAEDAWVLLRIGGHWQALAGAARVADTLRRELADVPILWKDEALHVTASFGVSVALPAEVDSQALISRADAALYRAKDQGRNCVRLAAEPAVA